MKKILTLILCAAMLAASALPASAAHVSADEAVETLAALGLFLGSGEGYELDRAATRAEAAVMLLRLLGQYGAAEEARVKSPFRDGGWADIYLGYAYEQGLVAGRTARSYGSADAVSARDWATMALRALGYAEGTDFTWNTSLAFADAIGLTHGEYTAAGEFLREDMALIAYTALTLKPKGSALRLVDKLYAEGAVTAEALERTRLASAVNTGRTAYTAAEAYELASSAVFLVEVYETEEDLEKGEVSSRGSGFFLTGDGVAALCYHELEGARFARVTTTDGHTYELTGVLYYEVDRDLAVVRVSRTDTEGETARFFPYLDLGDSDAVSAGDAIYSVSNPLGLALDSLSEGIVSNRRRTLYVEDYPYIQHTAPTSQGSSGGPLLNAYGEVVGYVYGSYTNGELLHLAVPANALKGVGLSGEGTPLSEVYETEQAKKDAAVLTADRTELTVRVGETEQVLVSSDCPGILAATARTSDWDVTEVTWGEFVTMQSCILKITGLSTGETDVTVTFVSGYGNEDAELVIHVRVTAADAEEE